MAFLRIDQSDPLYIGHIWLIRSYDDTYQADWLWELWCLEQIHEDCTFREKENGFLTGACTKALYKNELRDSRKHVLS